MCQCDLSINTVIHSYVYYLISSMPILFVSFTTLQTSVKKLKIYISKYLHSHETACPGPVLWSSSKCTCSAPQPLSASEIATTKASLFMFHKAGSRRVHCDNLIHAAPWMWCFYMCAHLMTACEHVGGTLCVPVNDQTYKWKESQMMFTRLSLNRECKDPGVWESWIIVLSQTMTYFLITFHTIHKDSGIHWY